MNAVGFGHIDTPLLAGIGQEAYDALVALHPAGRPGRAEEVAELVAFLLSERASLVQSSYRLVDGAYARPLRHAAAGEGEETRKESVMKARQYRTVGAPPEVVTVPDPEPGPGQVLLKVTAAGVCHSDIAVMSWSADPLPPRRPPRSAN